MEVNEAKSRKDAQTFLWTTQQAKEAIFWLLVFGVVTYVIMAIATANGGCGGVNYCPLV